MNDKNLLAAVFEALDGLIGELKRCIRELLGSLLT